MYDTYVTYVTEWQQERMEINAYLSTDEIERECFQCELHMYILVHTSVQIDSEYKVQILVGLYNSVHSIRA